MLQAVTVSVLLALAPQATPESGKTLWVVQPLYPGQDMLVTRSEEALRRLMSGSLGQLIGRAALAEHMQGKKADLRCLTGEVACTDPADAFVGSLGLERVVLLKAGQEDAAYRIKATSYQPATGEVAFAEGANNSLDRALLSALVKVVPLASTLDLTTDPSGATVFIDGEKVGLTPFSGQILPGDRLVRVEMPSHMPVEKKIEVPVRGRLALNQALEKVPASIVVIGLPAGTAITIDGVKEGVDKVERGIQPGKHHVVLELEGHTPVAEDLTIQPGATGKIERTLVPTGWTSFKRALFGGQEGIYGRSTTLRLSYEFAQWNGNRLIAKEGPAKKIGQDTDFILGRQLLQGSSLNGLSVEYSHDGKYFGVLILGGAFLTGPQWTYTLENSTTTKNSSCSGNPGFCPATPQYTQTATPFLFVLRAVQPHLRFAFWRIMIEGQAGFEVRGLLLHPSGTDPHYNDLWVVDPLFTLQIGARGYIYEGFFVEAAFRYSWDFFFRPVNTPAPLRGIQAGIGYAF